MKTDNDTSKVKLRICSTSDHLKAVKLGDSKYILKHSAVCR